VYDGDWQVVIAESLAITSEALCQHQVSLQLLFT
jgi:hypothetical protein